MNDKKSEVVEGLLRSIIDLCVTALAVLEPEEPNPFVEEDDDDVHPLKKRLSYLGENDETEEQEA